MQSYFKAKLKKGKKNLGFNNLTTLLTQKTLSPKLLNFAIP